MKKIKIKRLIYSHIETGEVLFGGGNQRGFNRLKKDFLVNTFVTMNRVHHTQQFTWIHCFPSA